MITSKDNDKIKYVQKLIKSGQKRREEGVFIVEGIRMVREIPKNKIVEIYYTNEALSKYNDLKNIVQKLDKTGKAYAVTENVFAKISDTGTPQGILALVKMRESDAGTLLKCDTAPLILILEKLQDPGNMGTIIRMAEGAGVTGILVSNDSVDIYNPKVVRSTMGSIFRMNICLSENLKKDIRALKEAGIKVYAMHLDGDNFYDKDLTGPAAFLIGNEGNGLSDDISRLSDELLKIPMMGRVESLNAAISASVLSYEALRQRQK